MLRCLPITGRLLAGGRVAVLLLLLLLLMLWRAGGGVAGTRPGVAA